MAAHRDEIIGYLAELLQIDAFHDFGPNGVQVVGSDTVTAIATAVSCSERLFTDVAHNEEQMLLVHHGLFWRSTPQVIDRFTKRRLKLLFDHDITLAAYHLPLDAHPTLGNNALIASGLGLTIEFDTPFAVYDGQPVGCVAVADTPIAFTDLRSRLEMLTGYSALHVGSQPASVSRVAICSGGAARHLGEAITLGVDLFVTGEPSEPAQHQALEAGIAMLAAGHYATETFGIRALGDDLARRFSVTHHFHDLPNPV